MRRRSAQVAAGRGLGDAGVVRGGREGDVEGFVCEGGAEAVRVHKEEGAFWGVPAWRERQFGRVR